MGKENGGLAQKIVWEVGTDLVKVNDLLKTYEGYSIRLWSYQPSLSRLELRIDRGASGNFHLKFCSVDTVIIPRIHWHLNGRIERETDHEMRGTYLFRDEASGVRIVSGPIRLEENVEPFYA